MLGGWGDSKYGDSGALLQNDGGWRRYGGEIAEVVRGSLVNGVGTVPLFGLRVVTHAIPAAGADEFAVAVLRVVGCSARATANAGFLRGSG